MLRASKSHYLFKSYGDFAEWVDFVFGGASAVEGLLSLGPTLSSFWDINTMENYLYLKGSSGENLMH